MTHDEFVINAVLAQMNSYRVSELKYDSEICEEFIANAEKMATCIAEYLRNYE